MANFDLEFPNDFLKGLVETDAEQLCEEMLSNAAPILEKSMKDEVKKITKDYSTGAAATSIRAGTPKKTKNGAWIVNINPKGYSNHTFRAGKLKNRVYKVSNALKLIWLNFGILGQQSARPFLTKAKNNVEDKVIKNMQETYNKKVGGGK